MARTPPRGSIRFLELEDTFFTPENSPHSRPLIDWNQWDSDSSTENPMTQEATETTVPEIQMEDQLPLEGFATLRQESGWTSGSRFSAREEEATSQTTRAAEKQPATEVNKDDLLF